MVITQQFKNTENVDPFTKEGRDNLFFSYFDDVLSLTDDIVEDKLAKEHKDWQKTHPKKF